MTVLWLTILTVALANAAIKASGPVLVGGGNSRRGRPP